MMALPSHYRCGNGCSHHRRIIILWSILIFINLSICRLSCYAFQQQQSLASSSASTTRVIGNIFSIRNKGELCLKQAKRNDSGNDFINTSIKRRSFLVSSFIAASFLPGAAFAEDGTASIISSSKDDDLIDVYFGCGCFWHVHHELIEAERNILGRSDDKLTSRAAYAGGNLGMKDGKVCYHNVAQISDYGKLGHAEIVSLRIPSSKFKDFAIEYFKLFKDGMRPDQLGDRGLEYRNVVGFNGGAKNTDLSNQLVDASKEVGDALDFAVGKGTDRDIPKLVWIMDNAQFPAYVAEQYHQFHDGFNFGENYPNSYNSLAGQFSKAGENFGNCPRL